MNFENEDTKRLFTPAVEKDRRIIQPAGATNPEYAGPLSQVPPPVAEAMYLQGSNLLKKATTTHASTKASSEKS